MRHRMAAVGGVIVLAGVFNAATDGADQELTGVLLAAAPGQTLLEADTPVALTTLTLAGYPAPSLEQPGGLASLDRALGPSSLIAADGVGTGRTMAAILTPGAAALAIVGGAVAVRRRR